MFSSRIRSLWIGAASALALCLIGFPQAALSQQGGDIAKGVLGIIVQSAAINAARKSWSEVDPEIQTCLRKYYGINPEELANNGIKATDERVVPYIDACRSQIEEKKRRQARVATAQRAWANVAVDVHYCLRTRYGIDPNQLAQNGVSPDDQQVRSYLLECRYQLDEGKRQQEEAAMREQQEREAQQRAREEAAMREQEAREARIADLKTRFPADWVEKILKGEVDLGWSKEAVRESIGEPRQKMNTPDGTEMWTYERLRLVFTDGKVTYIERL